MRRLRLANMALCFCLLLVFLSSCSAPAQNPPLDDDKNMTDSPQFASEQNIPPTRPFPDFPPMYLQFVPEELIKDFDEGTLVVKKDGILADYQPWYEFVRMIDKNKDAALTIQTFDLDLSKEVNDKTRYTLLDRYRLSVSGDKASWEYFADDKNNIFGELSLGFDEKTGVHEVLIGDTKVFQFIYFPIDLRQAALYFGYTPLKDLPTGYTSEEALKDGCLVIEDGVIQNIDELTRSGDPFGDAAGYFIRIFSEDDKEITITDVGHYNERVCTSVDYSRHSSRDNMEDTYITTYYDNYGVQIGGGDTSDTYVLVLGSDFRETIFVIKDMPFKKD